MVFRTGKFKVLRVFNCIATKSDKKWTQKIRDSSNGLSLKERERWKE